MNVKGEIKGDHLILTIDLSAKAQRQARPSSTGKTKLIASTNGFINYGEVKVSVNATMPLK
ncbi:hypothetical protein [Bradyrhizobium sp.]|uniref:hypothetical protein n=1 Tax=Bradyrhizobium sp. TaxID=376 RepID=UPI0007C8BFCD|nr:hypothetical protein [Bradyrhizobium sp.]